MFENYKAYFKDFAQTGKGAEYSNGVFKINSPYGPMYYTPGLTSGYMSLLAYFPCLDSYIAYSINAAPVQGVHGEILNQIIPIAYNSDEVKKSNFNE
ncbi:hypothetical protein [Piscirickettsia litoralis]|uniref:Uncharacterized protein n=1 Tax=Piscirickettsia litoralis TaxID=1891921 RepID=A0ABX3A184_9GAMM|nr:hypothetical protein [Piscirickettsia litoralis]ODN42632.1 hypothetical protein BGC07_06470 [Piscirickettsia litoralis]